MSGPAAVETILAEATRAFARQRYDDAAAGYERCIALAPRQPALHFNLGTALETTGRRDDAATLFSIGDDLDPAVRLAKDRPELDAEIRRRSATADRVMREHFTRLHEHAVDDFARDAGPGTHTADLAPLEREAIQFAIDARGRWLRERRVPER